MSWTHGLCMSCYPDTLYMFTDGGAFSMLGKWTPITVHIVPMVASGRALSCYEPLGMALAYAYMLR